MGPHTPAEVDERRHPTPVADRRIIGVAEGDAQQAMRTLTELPLRTDHARAVCLGQLVRLDRLRALAITARLEDGEDHVALLFVPPPDHAERRHRVGDDEDVGGQAMGSLLFVAEVRPMFLLFLHLCLLNR